MKKTWLTNSKEIKLEINNLINNKIGLIFTRKGANYQKTWASGIVETEGNNLLILKSPEEFSSIGSRAVCYYHIPGKPLRGFQCITDKCKETFLGVKFPNEIFEIQRRKSPRIPTPNQSAATFSIKGRLKIYHGYVVDCSRHGAKIKGEFPNVFSKDDTLTPLSLQLFLRFKRNQETIIQIPEAIIAWSMGDDDKTELGINFNNGPDEQLIIDEYIDLRTIEDESFTSTK